MKKFLLLAFMFFSFNVYAEILDENNQEVPDYTQSAKSAILIEASTGKILYKKNISEPLAPASLTKSMTLLLIAEAIDQGQIKMNDIVLVSKNAQSLGGSQIYIGAGDKLSVYDLLKGIGISSANDASVALAEYISGTEASFVDKMNKRASQLGLKNTNFKNSHGLDEDGHYTTVEDLAIISRELIKYDFILKITNTYEEHININGENRWLVNTNKLIGQYEEVDGLKTGHTDNAGYCIITTMKKNNMRLIAILLGSNDMTIRNREVMNLLEYGYNLYESRNILKNDSSLGKIYVDKSINKYYEYYLEQDINLVQRKNSENIDNSYDIKLYELKAPISKDTVVGKLLFKYGNSQTPYNIVIKDNIKKVSYLGNLYSHFMDIISGNLVLKS